MVGGEQDLSTDLWSLGCLLYHMLHASSPFQTQGRLDPVFSYVWINRELKASHTFILEFNLPLMMTRGVLTWCVLATGADAMKETLSKVVLAQYQIAAHVSLHARDLIHRLLQVVRLVLL